MGMSAASSQDEGATPYINVTPLIDVLLVLLIIFMVISPLKPSRFQAQVPAEPKEEEQQSKPKPNPLTLVISIEGPERKLKLNKDDMGNITDPSGLANALSTIFKTRESNGVFKEGTNEVEKTVFIKAPRLVKYGEVVKVIDAVKGSGATPIGLQIDDLPEN
jgi:biopolymer transport protein ExbD